MNSYKEVKFSPKLTSTRRREPVSSRFERQNESLATPRSVFKQPGYESSRKFFSKIEQPRTQSLEKPPNRTRFRDQVDSDPDTSFSIEFEDTNSDDPTISNSSSSISSSTWSDDTLSDLDQLHRGLDPNAHKIVQGSDLLSIYHSFAKWFSGLRNAFGGGPTSSPSNRSFRILKPNARSNRSTRPRRKTFDDPADITGDVARDANLTLNYEPKSLVKPWNDSMVHNSRKFKQLMKCRCDYSDLLNIWPGVGSRYEKRLRKHVPDVGTLLELYLSVDENTFKSLLQEYADINHYHLNLIYSACKGYVRRHGFKFNDVVIKPSR